jgi:hypothetical protein
MLGYKKFPRRPIVHNLLGALTKTSRLFQEFGIDPVQVGCVLTSNMEGNARTPNKRFSLSVYLVTSIPEVEVSCLLFPKLKSVVKTWRSSTVGKAKYVQYWLSVNFSCTVSFLLPREPQLETSDKTNFYIPLPSFRPIIVADGWEILVFHRHRILIFHTNKSFLSYVVLNICSCKFLLLHNFWNYNWYKVSY